MTNQKRWTVLASLALALVAVPAIADAHDHHCQGKMMPAGSLVEAVALDSLPAAARSAILRWTKGGKLDKVEMHTLRDGRVFYEAHISKEGQGVDVVVAPDGQTVANGYADCCLP